MKKILAVVLTLVMVMCFSVNVFAAGVFVNSPTENLAPTLVFPTDGSIVIYSYGERDELPDDQRDLLEEAYDTIKNADDIEELNGDLGNTDDLSVSDLFNVGFEGTGSATTRTVTLSSDTINNFAALMVYVNGEWIIVNSAKIQNGNLVFDAEHYGPYAIVVNNNGVKSPQTSAGEAAESNNLELIVYGAIMVVSACGAVVMWKKSKKHTA